MKFSSRDLLWLTLLAGGWQCQEVKVCHWQALPVLPQGVLARGSPASDAHFAASSFRSRPTLLRPAWPRNVRVANAQTGPPVRAAKLQQEPPPATTAASLHPTP